MNDGCTESDALASSSSNSCDVCPRCCKQCRQRLKLAPPTDIVARENPRQKWRLPDFFPTFFFIRGKQGERHNIHNSCEPSVTTSKNLKGKRKKKKNVVYKGGGLHNKIPCQSILFLPKQTVLVLTVTSPGCEHSESHDDWALLFLILLSFFHISTKENSGKSPTLNYTRGSTCLEISGTAKSSWMQSAGTSVQKGKLGEGEEGGGWRSRKKKTRRKMF